jgi:hypothetical protein
MKPSPCLIANKPLHFLLQVKKELALQELAKKLLSQ